jgi:hypothetical protein
MHDTVTETRRRARDLGIRPAVGAGYGAANRRACKVYGRNADSVFGGLQFPAHAATPVQWRPEVDGALDWAAPYLHLAPGGQYAVWTAFIAAPLSRTEAGVGDDAILWAGVIGGGASTRAPLTVTVTAGQTTAPTVPLTDANGWACPCSTCTTATSMCARPRFCARRPRSHPRPTAN